jgi:hypothetical protein
MGRYGLARQGIRDWFPTNRARPKEDRDEGIPKNQVQVYNKLGEGRHESGKKNGAKETDL